VATAPTDWLDAGAELMLEVATGGGEPPVVVTWPVGTCATRGEGRMTCRTTDRAATAMFWAVGGSWKYKVRLARLRLLPPLGAPVSVHLRYGGEQIDRTGSLELCTQTAGMLRCRSS